MSNLEHLIENGINRIDKMSHDEWIETMKKDCNWQGNEHITMHDLWVICQYVVYVHDEFKDEIT